MSRGPTERFRNEVLLALHAEGFSDAYKAPQATSDSPQVRGDVLGIAGVTVAVRCQRDLALAEAADEVAREAAAEGNDIFVSIQARRNLTGDDDGVLQSYCTMPLSVLLTVLQRLGQPVG